MERNTYWCHECDMSVSLLSSSSSSSQSHPQPQPLLCPQCFGDFIEQMDSHSSRNGSSAFSFPSLLDDDGDGNGNNYLQRLIHHLTTRSSAAQNDNDDEENDDDNDNDDDDDDDDDFSVPRPASKSSIDAIPTIRIADSILNIDPFLLCAVCKDPFELGVEAKQLPCKHLYHPDCILPWLAHHNSCPVCRFRLPAERATRDDFGTPEGVLRLGDLMTGEEDWFDYASTLRYIARRHNLLLSSAGHGGGVRVATEMETGLGGRSSSLGTVSSCPVEGRARLSGGDGDIGLSSRINEEGDAAVSGIKVSSSSVSEDLRSVLRPWLCCT
ncbi:43kDa postsynaptic protein [Parasponia andersonii]|uniref:RING-type E3 ubiquitin transferase n=1 Tax=Parasponia andersonii TaxID=3476 RepID=A0A2P5A6R1_PARAD|nr:43kDa postsynaptic protein [Parasponia andersonii]